MKASPVDFERAWATRPYVPRRARLARAERRWNRAGVILNIILCGLTFIAGSIIIDERRVLARAHSAQIRAGATVVAFPSDEGLPAMTEEAFINFDPTTEDGASRP